MAFKLRSGNKPSFKMMGASPAKQRTIVGENTSEILKDQKGKDYSLALHDTDAGINKGDTIRPGKAPRVGNYIMGGDYELEKKGDKNYEIKSPAKQKGTKKMDMPDFASPEQVKAKTGGNAKKFDSSKIKSPAKQKGSKKVDFASPALNEVSGFPEMDTKTTNKAPKKKAPKNLKGPAKKSPAKSRADRKAGKAAKAAVKGAQAADVGKTGKANRKAAKAAGAAAASGTPMLQKKKKYRAETARGIETAGGGKSDHTTFTDKKGKSVDYQQYKDADGNVTTYKTKYSNKRGKDGSYQTKRKTISNKRGERQIKRKLKKSYPNAL